MESIGIFAHPGAPEEATVNLKLRDGRVVDVLGGEEFEPQMLELILANAEESVRRLRVALGKE